MKEKDIVDFTKFEKDADDNFIDGEGEHIGCEICYTHEKAYKYFEEDERNENMIKISIPRCPFCGKRLIRRYYYTSMCGNAVVSEVNYSNPDGNIGFYSIWECETCLNKYNQCEQVFALMPEPIAYNANHDIYYTGGNRFIESKELNELITLIKSKVIPSVVQYIKRVNHPECTIDNMLSENNLKLWVSDDIEHAVAEWLYNHGWKK